MWPVSDPSPVWGLGQGWGRLIYPHSSHQAPPHSRMLPLVFPLPRTVSPCEHMADSLPASRSVQKRPILGEPTPTHPDTAPALLTSTCLWGPSFPPSTSHSLLILYLVINHSPTAVPAAQSCFVSTCWVLARSSSGCSQGDERLLQRHDGQGSYPGAQTHAHLPPRPPGNCGKPRAQMRQPGLQVHSVQDTQNHLPGCRPAEGGVVQQDRKGAALGWQTRNLEVLECRAATDGSAGTEPESQAFPGLGWGEGRGKEQQARSTVGHACQPLAWTPLRGLSPQHQRRPPRSSTPPGADLQQMQHRFGSLPDLAAQWELWFSDGSRIKAREPRVRCQRTLVVQKTHGEPSG